MSVLEGMKQVLGLAYTKLKEYMIQCHPARVFLAKQNNTQIHLSSLRENFELPIFLPVR